MAITHDFDIGGAAQGLNLTNNIKPSNDVNPANIGNQKKEKNVIQKQVTIKEGNLSLAPIDELKGMKPSVDAAKTTEAHIIPQNSIIKTASLNTTDPLRELVLCSKSYESDPEKLNHLAVQAANLPITEEVQLKVPNAEIKALAGFFIGTGDLPGGGTIKKKFAALDPNDSEDFGDAPLLGRISRARRAKSANKRNGHKFSDTQKLIKSESSSSDSITGDVVEKSDDNLDYAEERIKQVKESEIHQYRPINIDHAVHNDQISSEVSKIINVVEEGEGADLECANVKEKRKKRCKTAKSNRVVPLTDVNTRSCYSANYPVDSDNPPESPDPLESWSTKGIKNMNSILAWEEDSDSI